MKRRGFLGALAAVAAIPSALFAGKRTYADSTRVVIDGVDVTDVEVPTYKLSWDEVDGAVSYRIERVP